MICGRYHLHCIRDSLRKKFAPLPDAIAAIHREMREQRHQRAADRGWRGIASLDMAERDTVQRRNGCIELRGEGVLEHVTSCRGLFFGERGRATTQLAP